MDPRFENGSPEFHRGYLAGALGARILLLKELTEWTASTREEIDEAEALLEMLSKPPQPDDGEE